MQVPCAERNSAPRSVVPLILPFQSARMKAPNAPSADASVGVATPVDHARHHAEQQQHRADDPEHAEFFHERDGWRRRCARRILPGKEPDGCHDGEGHKDTGDDAADQQRADIHLGEQAVDHERDRWRDQHRQRARDRDHAGGHFGFVSLLQHRRQAGRRERRRRSRAGAADGAETGAGQGGRHAQAAGNPSHPGGSRLEQIVGNAADQHEFGHQQEHRDGDQFIGCHGRQRRGLQDARQDRHAADQVESQNAGAGHCKADRRADREQHEQHDHGQS